MRDTTIISVKEDRIWEAQKTFRKFFKFFYQFQAWDVARGVDSQCGGIRNVVRDHVENWEGWDEDLREEGSR